MAYAHTGQGRYRRECSNDNRLSLTTASSARVNHKLPSSSVGATLAEARENLAEAIELVMEANRTLAEELVAGQAWTYLDFRGDGFGDDIDQGFGADAGAAEAAASVALPPTSRNASSISSPQRLPIAS
jgi:hypothetical protein